MELPGELDFPRLAPEDKYRRAVPGYMKRLARLYQAMHERFGEAGLELIREVSREFGTAIGENAKKGGEIKGVAAVGRYLLKVFDMVSDDWEVREFTPERLVIGVRRCPYPFTEKRICRAHTCMEESLVAALDHTLEYQIGRSIPGGDAFCEHILCRRAPARG